MNPQTTRPSLLSRVRDGSDHGAWHEFEARYRELILRYAYNRGLQPADAEDVLQVVLLNLSKALRNFEYRPERGRFRSYLGRVVRHAAGQVLARPNAAPRALDSHVEAALADPEEPVADALWEQEWIDHHYRLALATVRATFEARSVQIFDKLLAGEPVSVVARDYQMSEQAVHKVKQRIRDRMKELIRDQVREEDEPNAA